MERLDDGLHAAHDAIGKVVIVEAERGQARQARVQQWLEQEQRDGAVTWYVPCDRRLGGPWGGLRDLISALVPQIQAVNPELLNQYEYELAFVLPPLRRILPARGRTLTETAPTHERVRNYPADRALRIVHGIVDLLDTWHQRTPDARWIIACDDYDRAGQLVDRFFAELMRRRGHQLKITLLIMSESVSSASVTRQFDTHCLGPHIQLLLSDQEAVSEPTPVMMTMLAQDLQQRIGDDPLWQEYYLPQLTHYWQHSDQPEMALPYLVEAQSLYTTQAFYADGIEYGIAALAHVQQHWPEQTMKRCLIQLRLHYCYLALQQVQAALDAIEDVMARTDDPEYIFRGCYLLAMLYTRYLPQRDFARAEAYLEQGLLEIQRTTMPEHGKIFQSVFNRNGLALVRHFQGRPTEAIELCQAGYTKLNDHLSPNEHQLHRSVLLYNIAQVYGSIGAYDEAIAHFTAVMEMDPFYSEYYNERGNMYLKLGRIQEARLDYLQAIQFSPPYAEVWTNLGQCYRLLGYMQEAIDACSRAIDLDPTLALPLLNRAQAFEALEQSEAALADYNATLSLKPNQPLALASRAVLHYEAGQLETALNDLDEAIRLMPQLPDLYQNRAVALKDLGRQEAAARDLQTYLELCPEAEDRSDVEHTIELLQASTSLNGKVSAGNSAAGAYM